uniref:VWFA domain-containing protein n=1 Tax=Anas zonorhyncha TaxID=75864 RepID=A0A8B9V3H4_9AVES
MLLSLLLESTTLSLDVRTAKKYNPPLSLPLPGAQPSISNAEGDILFLLDSSGSVSYYEFSKVKEFMWDLVRPFSFGPKDVQTSIIHISTTPTMEFPFDRYQSRGGVQQAIRDTRQLMGDTNTGQALSYAKEKFFSNEAGARPEVPKVLVWVTDGFSTDDISEPMQLLKDMGVTVFIVSTGRGNYLELSAAASQPPEKHLHFVDVDDLPIITKELRDAMLGTAGPGCAPWESAAGATGALPRPPRCLRVCLENVRTAKKYNPPLSLPLPGAQPSISNAEGDILFLLDSSGSVSYYEFSKVKEFMWDLVRPFSFGPKDVQTSIIHISTTPTMEFPFDRYQSRGGVQQAIRDTRQLMGDTNTGQALSYAKEKFFSNEAGARPEVPKVLVWVTDGFSTDDISEPMQLLKDMGVTVFIVSTGRGNYLELSAAASQPPEKHLHFVDVDDLPIITKELRDGCWLLLSALRLQHRNVFAPSLPCRNVFCLCQLLSPVQKLPAQLAGLSRAAALRCQHGRSCAESKIRLLFFFSSPVF